jgi:hypothetical protein
VDLSYDLLEILEPFGSIRNDHLQDSILGNIVLHELDKLNASVVPKIINIVTLHPVKTGKFALLQNLAVLHFLFQLLEEICDSFRLGRGFLVAILRDGAYSQCGLRVRNLHFVRAYVSE